VFFDGHYQVSVTDNTRQDNTSLLYFPTDVSRKKTEAQEIMKTFVTGQL